MPAGKRHLPESEIQELRRMGEKLRPHLAELPREKLEKLVEYFSSAYEITARFSNATHRWLENPTEENMAQVQRCAADYSPNYFSKHAGDVEVVVDELTVLHQDSEGMSAEEIREFIQARLEEYRKELHKAWGLQEQLELLPPRTPRR